MALGQIQKGVRELIRVVMRERGMKHRSTPLEICSICYAQQPTMTVEYEGPIFITYDEPIVKVVCYGHTEDLHYFGKNDYRPSMWKSNVTFSDFRSHRKPEFIVGEIGIDVHDPKFCDILGEFLDKHIVEENKRPATWKRIYHDTDQDYYFVATKEHQIKSRFLTVRQAIARWIMLKFFKIDPIMRVADYDWYWKQTVKRHFRCTEEDLEQVEHTVHALKDSGLDREEIQHNTKLIVDGTKTEY